MSEQPELLPRTIVTPRLTLSLAQVSDAAEQMETVTASLNELRQWLPWARQAPTLLESEQNLAEACANYYAGKSCDWIMRENATHAYVGRISIFKIQQSVPKGEIGYWLATAWTGRGFMTEAVCEATTAAFGLGYRRLEIRCDSLNVASARVAEAAGFTRDAIFVNDDVAADSTQLRDTLVFSRTV